MIRHPNTEIIPECSIVTPSLCLRPPQENENCFVIGMMRAVNVARMSFRKGNSMQIESTVQQPIKIIFGAGNKGRMLLRMLNTPGNGSRGVLCFIDSDPNRWGSKIEDCPVMAPEYLLTLPLRSYLVYVAVGPGYGEVRDILAGYDLTEDVDFVDACITPTVLSEMDAEFRGIREQIEGCTLLSNERLHVLHQFALASDHLSGEAAEVGVYRGDGLPAGLGLFSARQDPSSL